MGWNTLVHLDSKRQDGFIRLVRAGGGDVTILEKPMSQFRLGTFSHVFIDACLIKECAGLAGIDGPNCLLPEYVAEYLISGCSSTEAFRIVVPSGRFADSLTGIA